MTDNASVNHGVPKVSTFFISNMDCVNEEKTIREGLARIAGIEQLDFDLGKRRLKITHTLQTDESLVASLKFIGMRATRVGPSA